jgi:hypothetical protein
MAGMGMSGISAHADDIYAEVTGNPKIWSIFEDLNGEQAEPLTHKAALRQFSKLAIGGEVFKANIEMVKEIARLNPGKGVGERLMIDGMALPAWCKQTPKGTPEQEAYRRRFTPEAGFRAYIHTHRNKEKVGPNSKQAVGKFLRAGKAWRGYYLVVIADRATGLPLVWLVIDASINEERAIVPLLSDLYRYWPDCPAKVIIGDSAWDNDLWCRLAEVDYGLHPGLPHPQRTALRSSRRALARWQHQGDQRWRPADLSRAWQAARFRRHRARQPQRPVSGTGSQGGRLPDARQVHAWLRHAGAEDGGGLEQAHALPASR